MFTSAAAFAALSGVLRLVFLPAVNLTAGLSTGLVVASTPTDLEVTASFPPDNPFGRTLLAIPPLESGAHLHTFSCR